MQQEVRQFKFSLPFFAIFRPRTLKNSYSFNRFIFTFGERNHKAFVILNVKILSFVERACHWQPDKF